MPDPISNTVGPALSWRLVHDSVWWYAWFESTGYTTSIHTIEEFQTEQEGNDRIAQLGLVPFNPPAPPDPEEEV